MDCVNRAGKVDKAERGSTSIAATPTTYATAFSILRASLMRRRASAWLSS